MNKDSFLGFPGAHYLGEEEKNVVNDLLDRQSIYRFYGLDLQNRSAQLESAVARKFSRQYVLALSSGTAALHCALYAMGVRAGDEVILPAYGWSADLMVILALGAVPVLAPIDRSLGLDPEALAQCFSAKTKAVIAIHMRGEPCALSALLEIAKAHDVAVIEDCAQCWGGTVSSKTVGMQGDIAIYSTQYHKMITSGEGGLLLTDDKSLYEAAYRFHDLGMFRRVGQRDPTGSECIQSIGLNYRITEIQAAIMLVQLEKLDHILQDISGQYLKLTAELAETLLQWQLTILPSLPDCARNHAFIVLEAASRDAAEEAFNALSAQMIPAYWEGNPDAHHYQLWVDFMDRQGLPYRLIKPEQTTAILDRLLYLYVSPI